MQKPTKYEQQVMQNIKTRQREGNAIPKQDKSAVNFFKTSQKEFFGKKEPLDKLELQVPLDDVRAPFQFPSQFKTSNQAFFKGKQPHHYPQYEGELKNNIDSGDYEKMLKRYQSEKIL